MLTASDFELGTDQTLGTFRSVEHPQLTVYAQRVDSRLKLTLGVLGKLPATLHATKGYSVERSESEERRLQYVAFITRAPAVNPAFVAVMAEALYRSSAEQDPGTSLTVFLGVLEEFRRLTELENRRLSVEELRGLVAELLLLRELMENDMSPADAVTSWRGPYGASFDFVFDARTALEVKSVHIGAKKVTISAPEQLDTDLEHLRLAVVPLEESGADAEGSFTVCGLVDRVRGAAERDADALHHFDQSLEASRLDLKDPAIADRRFTAGDLKCFRIDESFPALRRSAIPPEISNVSYDLSLQGLTRFEIPADAGLSADPSEEKDV